MPLCVRVYVCVHAHVSARVFYSCLSSPIPVFLGLESPVAFRRLCLYFGNEPIVLMCSSLKAAAQC